MRLRPLHLQFVMLPCSKTFVVLKPELVKLKVGRFRLQHREKDDIFIPGEEDAPISSDT